MSARDLEPSVQLWSPECEAGVLGGLMLENGAWDRISDMLEPAHFHQHSHGLVFTAIAGLLAANKPADIVTVLTALESMGHAETCGGLPYLNSLAQSVPSAANIRRYAEVVRERALVRGMLAAAGKAQEIAQVADGASVEQRLNEAVELFQALQVRKGRLVPKHIGEGGAAMLTRLDDLSAGRRTPGVPTRIPGFDRMLSGGLKPGKQIVLAARPSVGKSSLALAILLNLAADGVPCAFFSQEMEGEELTDRAVSNLGEVELDAIMLGKLDGGQWARITAAVDGLNALPLYFDEQGALTLADIQAKARELKRKHDIKALVLDYLQLCAGNPKADKRHHQIEEISRGLKTLAKQLGIAIITLSQLGREVEKRSSGRPVMSDLKESGAIEEDADVIIALSQAYQRQNGQRVIEAEFLKNRQGRKGSVMLAFTGEYQRWVETITEDRPLRPASKHYTEDV
jgi:replicative DNA helicase